MRIKALIIRIIQQMFRDKRTLALLFIAPLFILTIMYFLFNSNEVQPKLGIVNIEQKLVEVLESEDIRVTSYIDVNKDMIVSDELDGLLVLNEGKLELTLLNDNPNASKGLQALVNKAIVTYMQGNNTNYNNANIELNYVYGDSETSFFDIFSTILVGFFVFFFVFLIAGIGLLRERTTGTLERLMATPIKRVEMVIGYLVGYGIFAGIQTVFVVLYAINVLDIALVGSIWDVLLINLLLAIVALSLGIVLSTFASSEFQMMQFIPIAIIPQIFFAGIFPVEGMAKWLQYIGKIMPMYYGADALKGIMYKGFSLMDVIDDIIVLSIFAIFFIFLNIFALKKYRVL